MSMRLDDPDRRVLLRLAVGRHSSRAEHRFRHKETGETREFLDMRIHNVRDWESQWRSIIETEWACKP